MKLAETTPVWWCHPVISAPCDITMGRHHSRKFERKFSDRWAAQRSVGPNPWRHSQLRHFQRARRAPDVQRKTFSSLFLPHSVDNMHFNHRSCLGAGGEHPRYSNSRSVPTICHTERLSSAIKRWVVLSSARCPQPDWNEPDTAAGVHKHRAHILWRKVAGWDEVNAIWTFTSPPAHFYKHNGTAAPLKKRESERREKERCQPCMSQPFKLRSRAVAAYVVSDQINIYYYQVEMFIYLVYDATFVLGLGLSPSLWLQSVFNLVLIR